MGRYLARRLFLLLPVALGITIVTFFLLRLIPGDPAVIMLDNRATAENVARLRHQLGLDRPLYLQYLFFLENIATGRLGFELASIFLIFTSQAWNMAFGVYEAITTIPGDSLDALQSFGVHGLRKFRLLSGMHRTCNQFLTIEKRHLAGRNAADLTCQ